MLDRSLRPPAGLRARGGILELVGAMWGVVGLELGLLCFLNMKFTTVEVE